MNTQDLKVPTIVICHFDGAPERVIHYQVTLDPAKVAAGFIRLGEHPGDELTGWMPLDGPGSVVIDSVLGELHPDGKTVIPANVPHETFQ